MIAKGATEISKVCLGSDELSKVCLGTSVIWSHSAPVPFDAEVEYLGYNGNEYIDTGITPDQTIECEVTIMPTNNRVVSTGLFSARDSVQGGNPTIRSLDIWVNGQQVALNDDDYDSGWKNGLTYNQTCKIQINDRELYVNDTLIVQSGKTSTFSRTTTYGLLRCHYANDKWDTRSGSSGRLYYCKIWKGGVLVFDGIPVRVGQTGYIYDRISGNLIGNLGTDSFTLGPDKQGA